MGGGEIFLQLFALVIAVWLIKEGYKANKRAKPFSFRTLTKFDSQANDDVGYARGLLGGLAILGFLIIKFFTCGLVCGGLG